MTRGRPKGIRAEPSLLTKTTSEITHGSFRPIRLLEVLNKDANFVYRWLSKRKIEDEGWKGQAGWKDHRGWEIINSVNRSSETCREGQTFSDNSTLNDGTIRTGDLVLAKMPKEESDKRKAYYRRRLEAREEAMKVKKDFGQHGVNGHFLSQCGAKKDEINI